MKKTEVVQEPKERKDLTAKAFMKIVVENCFVNIIFFGFFQNFGNNNDLSILNKGHRHAFSFYSNINNNIFCH